MVDLINNLSPAILKESAPRPILFSSRGVCLYVSMYLVLLACNFFEDSHWPSDHMISSRSVIGQPPPQYFCIKRSFRYRVEDQCTEEIFFYVPGERYNRNFICEEENYKKSIKSRFFKFYTIWLFNFIKNLLF